MKTNHRVLIVDNEEDILELLSYNLEKEGYTIETAANGLEALDKAKNFNPQLILLDIMMPELDGVETCRRLRQLPKFKDTYIIFLTARSEEFSEIAAFEAGGNDYLNKPIKPRALMSRVSAFFKRDTQSLDRDVITIDDLVIDRTSYIVNKGDEKIILPKKEFELLYFLASRSNHVFSREDLLNQIWGTDVFVIPRTIDVHIRKLREKIGEEYITTVKGIGYKYGTN
jgi:two-component system alkaline phosphatase synthesis response regulator PhoP